jgi:hypothetical protein
MYVNPTPSTAQQVSSITAEIYTVHNHRFGCSFIDSSISINTINTTSSHHSIK